MRIAVNTRLLLPGRLEGLGTFTHEVLRRMVTDHPEHEFYFLFDREFDPQFIYASNVHPVIIGPPARHPFLFYLWFEWSVAAALRRIRADVFLSPDGYLSLRSPVKQIPVIHDLNFHYFPGYFSWSVRKHFLHYFPRYARKAARIATVSEFSKNDIIRLYGINPGKIDVIYNGAPQDAVVLSSEKIQSLRNEISGGAPYFLFIGALYPRKNLIRQLQAFEAFKSRTNLPHKFVLAGSRYRESEPLMNELEKMNYRHDVILLGRVEPRERLDEVLAASEALMFVSQFEGFGIPIIEAMRCQVPVITGTTSAMPEIGGNAVLTADPDSVEQIAATMERLAENDNLRKELIQKGNIIRKKFDWEITSRLLWDSIQKVVQPA